MGMDRIEDVFGDPEKANELMRRGKANWDFVIDNYKELQEQFPGEWIAVYDGELVEHDRDLMKLYDTFGDMYGDGTLYTQYIHAPGEEVPLILNTHAA